MTDGWRDQFGRRFARVATNAAVRTPRLWAALRPLVRGLFDAAAPRWDSLRMADTFLPYETALASVERKPGMPPAIRDLGPDGAALLVETRGADAAVLAARIAVIEGVLAGIHTATPFAFSTDPGEGARLWAVRKGMV